MSDLLGIDLGDVAPWINIALIAVAIAVIARGASWVVDAAGQIALRLGISELVVGLTIVAFGTSAPEFAVTLTAAVRGHAEISVSNIVGSNIFNLGFILGGAAALRAIPTSPTLVRRDGSVILLASAMLCVLGHDLRLDRVDGVVLLVLLGAYLAYLFRQRKQRPDFVDGTERDAAVETCSGRGIKAQIGILLAGLALVLAGSDVLVGAASAIARTYGVSEWLIGVTVVAAGTSVPELATTLAGVLKGRYSLSAGNMIGSDIFNMLGVLGLAAVVQPLPLQDAARGSLAAMLAAVLLVVVLMRTSWRLSRLDGLLMVLIAIARWSLEVVTRLS